MLTIVYNCSVRFKGISLVNCIYIYIYINKYVSTEFDSSWLLLAGPWAIRFPWLYIDLATQCWNGKVTLGQPVRWVSPGFWCSPPGSVRFSTFSAFPSGTIHADHFEVTDYGTASRWITISWGCSSICLGILHDIESIYSIWLGISVVLNHVPCRI